MEKKLTAVAIKNAQDGKHFDGGGLMLIKKGPAGKWVYRFSHLGKRREMGLGRWPDISLAEARK
ncbi:MAG: Arm DNA-binding domain-containing protein, partial [Silicimonas sp.]|nr:Arm DNA-binding domain-containing protein [Silicimonas sp.]